ncbi:MULTISPECIES: TIGR03943 family protein [Oscillatoriales]|nr:MULTISPECIES: TIGR03943 family protein [Oscillatoriales]
MTIQNPKSQIPNSLLRWLDVLAIIAWGILLLRYWLTGKLYLLIHPDYFWLVIAAGFMLLAIGSLRGLSLLLNPQRNRYQSDTVQNSWLVGRLDNIAAPQVRKTLIASVLWLVITAGGLMRQLFGFKKESSSRRDRTKENQPSAFPPPLSNSQAQHISLFPPGWSTALLLTGALLGFTIAPRPFTSQTALSRGITDSLTMTRSQPQEFRSAKRPEERSLIDWVRTLNAYPEPDAYTGQKVKVQGFAVHPPELPPEYLLLSRFILTCCAADAYPVGLPVKLGKQSINTQTSGSESGSIDTDTSSQLRRDFKPDTWLEVEGEMITENFGGKRQLTIQASSVKLIPEPKNPYDY